MPRITHGQPDADIGPRERPTVSPMKGRYVAVGDSFTEGVGDANLMYPNGVRGWADRMARQMGRADATWEYANFAIRSKRLDEIVDEQFDAALALEPTLDHVVVTRNTSPRSMDPRELGQLAAELYGDDRVTVVDSLPDALDRAAALADDEVVGGGVLATGSVVTAADVRMLLGVTSS